MAKDPRKPSKKLTLHDAVKIWHRYWDGEFQNRIAADLDVNPGRVNEVIKKRKMPEAWTQAVLTYRH
jgi:hypothetical protein